MGLYRLAADLWHTQSDQKNAHWIAAVYMGGVSMSRRVLLTKENQKRLIANHKHNETNPENPKDFWPVVKLFTPDAGATWLLTEYDPVTRIAFGLCDLGVGFPELGYVSLDEVQDVRGKFGLPVERDRHFKAHQSLSRYASDADKCRLVMA